jgi:hypothetical protein
MSSVIGTRPLKGKDSLVSIVVRSTFVFVAGASLFLLALAPAPSVQAAATDEQIVASMYPDSLLHDPALKGQTPDDKTYTFVRADLDASGSPDYLVAAYYNGLHDTVRIIRAKATEPPALAGDLKLTYIGGAPADVSVVDLDGDGKPEIHLSLPGGRRTRDWLFKWTNGEIVPFGPTETDLFGRVHTVLGALRILDIDGDGRPELLVPTETGETSTVYKLGANGSYGIAPSAVYYYHLVRGKGDPDALEVPIVVADPGKYTLTIVNGDSRGNNRTTAAYAEVNGEVIFPESAFKKADRVLSASVTLDQSNQFYFELRGAPGSEVSVAITKQP